MQALVQHLLEKTMDGQPVELPPKFHGVYEVELKEIENATWEEVIEFAQRFDLSGETPGEIIEAVRLADNLVLVE